MYRQIYIFQAPDSVVKIRKVMDKRIEDKTYYKYLITLPKELVENSNLFDKRLNVRLEKDKIIIEKLKNKI